MVETSSDRVTFRIPSNINDGAPLQKQPTASTLRRKKLHHRPPTGFQMWIWLEALWMWGVGGLQVHWICGRWLVYKEVVEVRSNYKKSYFRWCWLLQLNPRAWGEHLTSQLSWAAAWLLVTCGSPVHLVVALCSMAPYALTNGGSVGKFFWHGEYGFTYRELMLFWGNEYVTQTKLWYIAPGKWNVSRVSEQGFDISYIMLWVYLSACALVA